MQLSLYRAGQSFKQVMLGGRMYPSVTSTFQRGYALSMHCLILPLLCAEAMLVYLRKSLQAPELHMGKPNTITKGCLQPFPSLVKNQTRVPQMRRLEVFGKMPDIGPPTWSRRRGKGLRATWISILVISSSSVWHLGGNSLPFEGLTLEISAMAAVARPTIGCFFGEGVLWQCFRL